MVPSNSQVRGLKQKRAARANMVTKELEQAGHARGGRPTGVDHLLVSLVRNGESALWDYRQVCHKKE